jgi:osmoprotectant transport system ATP-binding protein
MSDPAFRLSKACKRYASNEGVGPIDLTLAEGSTTVLLGTSGAGKSTLLKLLNGLIVADSGEVLFKGKQVTRESRLQMGYVVQGGGLFPHLTAAQNVALVARWLNWKSDRINVRLEELAALVRLPVDSLQRYPRQLSGGQAQRVGLMRALMLDAPVLLLDEPLGALDPLTRFDLQQDLKEVFARLGKTVAIVTHDLSEAAFFGGTVLLFRAGHVEQQGTIDELVKHPATPFVERFVQAQRGVA